MPLTLKEPPDQGSRRVWAQGAVAGQQPGPLDLVFLGVNAAVLAELTSPGTVDVLLLVK